VNSTFELSVSPRPGYYQIENDALNTTLLKDLLLLSSNDADVMAAVFESCLTETASKF
jgi:hypothetical protein